MEDCPSGKKKREKGELKIPFGESKDDGRLLSVAEVPSGLACRCRCPFCESDVVANKCKPPRRSYFSHHNSAACEGSKSRGAVETLLHRFAKEIIAEHKWVRTPPVEARYGGLFEPVHPPVDLRLESVSPEVPMDKMQPDILATTRDNRELIIEVAVTHPCDASKVGLIRSQRRPAFEISLKDVPYDAPREVMRREVLISAPREWIYNEHQEQAIARLKNEILRREAAARAAWEAEIRAEAAKLREIWLAAPVDLSSPETARSLTAISDVGLERLLQSNAESGTCFSVPGHIWKATTLKMTVLSREAWYIRTFSIYEIAQTLLSAGHVKPAFAEGLSDDVARVLQEMEPGFKTWEEEIERYLRWLADQNILKERDKGWAPLDRVVEAATLAMRKANDIRERAATVRTLVHGLVANSGAHVQVNLDNWMKTRHAGLIASPDNLILEENLFGHLRHHLDQLNEMLCPNGPVVENLLGLPLERVREKRRAEQLRAETIAAELERKRRGILERIADFLRSAVG